jgi:hypothetical protein
MPFMFDLWKLKRKLEKARKQFSHELGTAVFSKEPAILDNFLTKGNQQLAAVREEIKAWHTDQLVNQAAALDLELPTVDSAWELNKVNDHPTLILRASARYQLRQLIDTEKTRRREVKAWWWKTVIIPAITALTGLAGVITGMIAVIHSKK